MKRAMKQSTMIAIFNAVTILLVLGVSIAFWTSNYYNNHRMAAYDDRYTLTNSAAQFMDGSSTLTDSVRAYASTSRSAYHDNYENELNTAKNRETGLEAMRKIGLSQDEEHLISQMSQISNQLVPLEEEAIRQAQEGNNEAAMALVYGSEYSSAVVQMHQLEADFLASLDQRTADQIQQLNTKSRISSSVLATLATVLLVLQIIQNRVVNRKLIRPVIRIEKEMQEISKGNLGSDFDLKPDSSEIGQLINSILETKSELKRYIDDISRNLQQMANKNMALEQEVDYVGDFKPIQQSLVVILDALNNTLYSINDAAAQVSAHADQVAAGSQALAGGATEQASTVEELSATVQELTGRMGEIARSADEAKHLTNEASESLELSSQKMDDMRVAMGDISDASQEIGKIIKTIEDIAFQTNILALNAAVEAARAGAAGKGFAVVADEVRNLATKSQEASRQTTLLIQNSTQAVQRGVQLANDTAEALGVVVEKSHASTTFVESIARDSEEQATALYQVSDGISQIAGVVQMNSATSEESAAASEELSTQSIELKKLVGEFQLRAQDNPFIMQ